MKYLRGTLRILLAQQSGQIQLLIIAPILTLSFLSLIVRTASSAVDPSLERKKVAEQLKRRLNEIQGEEETKFTVETPAPQPLPQKKTTHHVKKRTTVATILSAEGINPAETAEWLAVATKLRELRNLRIGSAMTLSFAKAGKGRSLSSLSYEVDTRSLLVVERRPDGSIGSRRESLPATLVWRGVGGRIKSNLHNAAITAGVPARLVDDLADMDWDLDLSSDLQPGDTFKVFFEEFQRDGRTIEYGKILAAEIVNNGQTFTLFAIPEDQDEASGSSAVSRQFLRYPLQFTRISSVFTYARFHPILERTRPHLGVDFAAPLGTPVRAVASGTVIQAGRKGSFGNFVRIDHPGPYDSAYAHLQRITKGIKVGSAVERGQVIGLVGSTGLATGPHLHFALYKDGKYTNPLTAKLAVGENDSQHAQTRMLDEKRKRLAEKLASLRVENQPVTLSMVAPQEALTTSRATSALLDEEQRFALVTSQRSPSAIPGLSTSPGASAARRLESKKTARPRGGRYHASVSSRHAPIMQSGKTSKSRGQQRLRPTTSRRSSAVRTVRR